MRVSPKGKQGQPAHKQAQRKQAQRPPASLPAQTGERLSGPVPDAVYTREVAPDYAGQRLDNFLLTLCKGLPKSHVYKLIRSGQVRVNRGRVQADYRLVAGDVLRLPPIRLPARPERFVPAARFPVVFEDDALLVVDKPAGLAVHGGSGVSFGVIEQLRAARPGAMLELVHRLDRDTSGLLMIAKTRRALTSLHQTLRGEDGGALAPVRKFYLALVAGNWPHERQHLRQPLLKWLTASNERRVRVAKTGEAGSKAAHTIVTRLQRMGAYTLVQAELRTGRTHQIRVHLAHQGFPIVGDDKYGGGGVNDTARAERAAPGFARMFLHASRLQLPHPLSGVALDLQAPLPDSCRRLLERFNVEPLRLHSHPPA